MEWRAEVINRDTGESHSVHPITECDEIQVIPGLRQGSSGKFLGVSRDDSLGVVRTYFVPKDEIVVNSEELAGAWLDDVVQEGATKILRTFLLEDNSRARVIIEHVPEA